MAVYNKMQGYLRCVITSLALVQASGRATAGGAGIGIHIDSQPGGISMGDMERYALSSTSHAWKDADMIEDISGPGTAEVTWGEGFADKENMVFFLHKAVENLSVLSNRRARMKLAFERAAADLHALLTYISALREVMWAEKGTLNADIWEHESSTMICNFEELERAALIPESISHILHDQRSLDTARNLVDLLALNGCDEDASNTALSNAIGNIAIGPDADVEINSIAAVGCLLQQVSTFPPEIKSVLKSRSAGLEDLLQPIEKVAPLLCNGELFLGRYLFHILFCIRSVLNSSSECGIILDLFEIVGDTLHGVKRLKHNLDVMKRKWSMIEAEYNGSSNDEEFIGVAETLGARASEAIIDIEQLLSLILKSTERNIGCDLFPALTKSEWSKHIVRHIMGTFPAERLAKCISLSLKIREVPLDNSSALAHEKPRDATNFAVKWRLLVDGTLRDLKVDYCKLLETFRLASGLQTRVMLSEGKGQAWKMNNIIDGLTEGIRIVVANLKKSYNVLKGRAWLIQKAESAKRCSFYLVEMQNIFVAYEKYLLATQDMVCLYIFGDNKNRGLEKRTKRHLSASSDGLGLEGLDVIEELFGLEMLSLYAHEPDVRAASKEEYEKVDLEQIFQLYKARLVRLGAPANYKQIFGGKYKILVAVREFQKALEKILQSLRRDLSIKKREPGTPQVLKLTQADFEALERALTAKKRMLRMPLSAESLLDFRLLLVRVLLGDAHVEQYMNSFVYGATALLNLLFAADGMTEEEFGETVGKIRRTGSQGAGMTYTLANLFAMSLSRRNVIEYIESEIAYLKSTNARGWGHRLKMQVLIEEQKTNFTSKRILSTGSYLERAARGKAYRPWHVLVANLRHSGNFV